MTVTHFFKPILAVGFFGMQSTNAFTIIYHAAHETTRKNPLFASAGASAVESSPYEQLGIEEGQLALGVDPNEVLIYIGTYVIYACRRGVLMIRLPSFSCQLELTQSLTHFYYHSYIDVMI